MRVSTTTLESFRLYMTRDFMSEAELLSSIRGEFKPNRVMQLGSAFHSILETPDVCVRPSGDYVADGIVFPGDVVAPCLPLFDRSGAFEVKATKDFHINGQTWTVVSKADQLVRLDVVENKTKWAVFDLNRYAESYQWRFYVDVYGAQRVRYNVFCLSEYADGEIGLRSIEQFNLYPYPRLAADCRSLLSEFVEYATKRNLYGFLKDKAA
jgi:hypothetical protein